MLWVNVSVTLTDPSGKSRDVVLMQQWSLQGDLKRWGLFIIRWWVVTLTVAHYVINNSWYDIFCEFIWKGHCSYLNIKHVVIVWTKVLEWQMCHASKCKFCYGDWHDKQQRQVKLLFNNFLIKCSESLLSSARLHIRKTILIDRKKRVPG